MSTTPTAPAPSALATHYTCAVCRKTFNDTTPVIVGQKPVERLMRTVAMLTDHFAKAHEREFQLVALASQEYMGWHVMRHFRHNDALMEDFSERCRLNFRRLTKGKPSITDEMIEAQVDNHLMKAPDTRAAAIALLKTLRDTLEEPQQQG